MSNAVYADVTVLVLVAFAIGMLVGVWLERRGKRLPATIGEWRDVPQVDPDDWFVEPR